MFQKEKLKYEDAIMKYMNKQTKVIRASDIKNYDCVEQIFTNEELEANGEDMNIVFIYYSNGYFEHVTCLIKLPEGGYEYFDTFSLFPKMDVHELEYATTTFLEDSNEVRRHLRKITDELDFNDYEYTKPGYSWDAEITIAWCIHRFENRHKSHKKFKKMVTKACKKNDYGCLEYIDDINIQISRYL